MGEPVEALSALCNGQIRLKPCRHAWLGLFECFHGDDGLLRGMEQTLFPNFWYSGLNRNVTWLFSQEGLMIYIPRLKYDLTQAGNAV